MSRRLAPATLLLAVLLAPAAARAQINIDEGKTPAHIFSSDCAVCHKSTRGLANGRGNAALTGFLSEHYTSSREEAAALAAYVLAGGGGEGKPSPVQSQRGKKTEHPAATAADETHGPAKLTRHTGKPETGESPTAKLEENPAHGQGSPVAEAHPAEEPAAAHERHDEHHEERHDRDTRGVTRARPKPQKPREAGRPEPPAATAAVTGVVAKPEAPPPAAVPDAEAPAGPSEAEPADNPPVPRDDIPD